MSKQVILPGLIDIHVHFRDPGQTHKEDFLTGSKAATSAGITTVFDMPNNLHPILKLTDLERKINIITSKAFCDWGLYFATNGRNCQEFHNVADKVVGLKLYLDVTTGNLNIEDDELIIKIFQYWPKSKIIVIHADVDRIDFVLDLCARFRNKIHITHVNSKLLLQKILDAKREKLLITCDVTPHHLFLSASDLPYLDSLGVVKPPIATIRDLEYLWDHLREIDIIASDHAPHTISEKKNFDPPSGMPGVETLLPLLLKAVEDKKMTMEDLLRMTVINPQKIFSFRQPKNTYIEVDLNQQYKIDNKKLFTKCAWSAFHNYSVVGKVIRTVIRGKTVFANGKFLVPGGFGRNVII